MTHWDATVALLIGAGIIGFLYNIFLEVRSIRRMMNHDRRISNEVHEFADD